ncbi:MAG: hypothetical protein CME16_00720 [Gemmatimonadetes bacterium]|nr:hypothetical protein [Gemmatimonadota bacterium]
MWKWCVWGLGFPLLLSWTGCAQLGETPIIMGGDEIFKTGELTGDTTAVAPAAGQKDLAEANKKRGGVVTQTVGDSTAPLSQTLLFVPFKDLSKYKGPWDIYSQIPRGLSDTLQSYDFFRTIPIDSVLARLKGREFNGRIAPEKALFWGRELNADYVVLGEIEDLSMKRFRATVPIGGYRSYQGIASVTLKLFKVIDGRSHGEVRGDGETDEKKYGVTNPAAFVKFEKEYLLLGELEWGSDEFHQTLLGQATGLCLQNLAAELANLIRPPPKLTVSEPKIIDIDGARAYINIGLAEGIQNGDKFGVWDEGRELTDPETGVFLGRALSRRIGVLQVEQVLGDRLSLVKIISGQENIQKGYLVRAE